MVRKGTTLRKIWLLIRLLFRKRGCPKMLGIYCSGAYKFKKKHGVKLTPMCVIGAPDFKML